MMNGMHAAKIASAGATSGSQMAAAIAPRPTRTEAPSPRTMAEPMASPGRSSDSWGRTRRGSPASARAIPWVAM